MTQATISRTSLAAYKAHFTRLNQQIEKEKNQKARQELTAKRDGILKTVKGRKVKQ